MAAFSVHIILHLGPHAALCYATLARAVKQHKRVKLEKKFFKNVDLI